MTNDKPQWASILKACADLGTIPILAALIACMLWMIDSDMKHQKEQMRIFFEAQIKAIDRGADALERLALEESKK